jgi:hypothetical protein
VITRKGRIGLWVALAGSVALGLVTLHFRRVQQEAAFNRDDKDSLGEEPLGLRGAYEVLKREGHRVALVPPSIAAAPDPAFAWWIVQAGPEWFESSEKSQEIKRFLERGGTVVLMPEEAVTPIPGGEEDDGTDPEHLDRFFSKLGLEVRILAFDPPAPETDEAEPEEDVFEEDEVPAEPSALTLSVSGDVEPFSAVSTVETSWGNYFDGESLLKADIRLHSDGFPLVAEFKLGKGTLVLVAESTYFENEFLDRAGNRTFLLALASHYQRGGIHFHPVH